MALVLAGVGAPEMAFAEPRTPESKPTHSVPDPQESSAYANALRIARSLHDERMVARLLSMQGMAAGATEVDLLSVVHAYEGAGTPDVAETFLRERIRRFPRERAPRSLLARLLARSGDSRKAVAAWRDLAALYGEDGMTIADAHAYARDLSRSGDVDGAWQVLVRMQKRVLDDASEYWGDLATLAWDRDEDAVALVAYERLYRSDPSFPHCATRLMTLLADAGKTDSAISVALAEFKRSGDANAAVFALQLRANRGDWRGVKAILDAVEKAPGETHERAEYHLVRGECAKHFGDLATAKASYLAALALAPDDPNVRANVIWMAIEQGDDAQLRKVTDAWRASAREQPALWPAMALALSRLGRHDEAIAYFVMQLKQAPDPRVVVDLTDTLAKRGHRELKEEVRRRAMKAMRAEAVAMLRSRPRSSDDVHLFEATVQAIRERSGVPMADRWMESFVGRTSLFASSSSVGSAVAPTGANDDDAATTSDATGSTGAKLALPGREEFLAEWYLSTGRPEFARRIVETPRDGAKAGPFRAQRLALALSDGDNATLRALADAPDLPAVERAHALVALERERDAAGLIGETLSRGEDGPETDGLREERERIGPYHRPNARAGFDYTHVTGLDVVGPTASAAHDGLGGRVLYGASGARMSDRSGLLALPEPRYEADAGAVVRFSSARGIREFGAALNYQQDTPVARATFFDQRLVTSRLGILTDVRIGSRIEDTAALRVAAVRNLVQVGARYDWTDWYGTFDVEGREDQTRHYEHVAWDAVETGEFGYKIFRREPHVDIGVMGQASQRSNRTGVPADIAELVPKGGELVRALPPSFQLVGGVIHLSRGDVTDRYRPDRAPFPRYDCEGSFGVLLPDTDTAVHVLCGASVRAPGGMASFLAFYNRGIAGVRNNESAQLALSYTIVF